jgi:maltoporin
MEREMEALRAELRAARDTPTIEGPAETAEDPAAPSEAAALDDSDGGQLPPDYADGFHFGSYGRVLGAGDFRGRPGRDADIVARGSRWDESTYAELELRREDLWPDSHAHTRIVATLALAHPLFHYNAEFDGRIAVRNLYLEERGLGLEGLSLWAGSRMYRGDDIYVLDWWPLDNLNTLGGGVGYEFAAGPWIKLHAGTNQPSNGFFGQSASRVLPLERPGATEVEILDRQQLITSAKVGHVFGIGKKGGLKILGYGETHHVRAGQREIDDRVFEDVPADHGYVAGGELSLFSGKRSTHLNLWVRQAWNLATYGEFAAPFQLAPDRTTTGARETIVALGGNYEVGPFGLMLGSYFRRFRDASPDLNFEDLDEGIVLLRPQLWFAKAGGVALEASWQIQQRGVLTDLDGDGAQTPQLAQLWRVGVMPFVSPAGRGSYTRPHLRAFYMLTARDPGARALYPRDDVFSLRNLDHLFGVGAEWWFGSTSYFRD